jgi:outer membrane protein OmpA-like peptidoglycan-associated protein
MHGMTKNFPLLQLTLVLGLGLAVSGCDTISEAANGVGNAVSNVASDLNPFPGDAPAQTADNDAPPSASADADASTSPDLANLPSRPTTSTPAQRQAAAQSLAADGAQARYSADALRAGTEAAAAPPSAVDMPPSAQVALNAPPSAGAPPSAQASVASAPPPSAPSAALSQGTGAIPAAGASAPVRAAALPSTAAAIPPGAEPAVPANAPVRRGGAMATGGQYASDASLGFKPSSAPPLSPSINQWVAAPIVARYRQTASNAGVSSSSMAAVPAKGAPISTDGAVMANMDAVSMGPSNSIAAMNGGVAPTAVIYFPGDGSTLSPAARTLIRNAVAQYKAAGGEGSVRVVGHASSRTANMPVEKHLEVIFDKSQSRANAVAQELIREGIPAAKVLVDAVGDSQPVYYESMPQGENGNRRAEIFVQG